MLSLTEALAFELRDSGVRAIAVSPGSTKTELFDVAGARAMSNLVTEHPGLVVARTLAELDRRSPRASFVSGAANGLLPLAARLLPRRVMTRFAQRAFDG